MKQVLSILQMKHLQELGLDTSDASMCYCWQDMKRSPREAFSALIDKVSGKGMFASNPYVFAYEFELID